MSNILMLASTTTLKASLISHMAMSSFFRPAASRAWQDNTHTHTLTVHAGAVQNTLMECSLIEFEEDKKQNKQKEQN